MRFECLVLASYFLLSSSYDSTIKLWRRRFHISVVAGDWIYIDGGDVAYYDGDTDGKYDRENNTYGLDLSKDWTNSSLKLIHTERPSDSPALNSEALWYDNKHNIIYCFGGDKSFATPALNDLGPPPDSIWGFQPNNEGSGAWHQVLGPGSTPFPSDIHRLTTGMSANDGSSAYYFGGVGSSSTSLGLPKNRIPFPGMLVFDFDTLTMTKTSANGYIPSQNYGNMINIPSYGENGILVILPDGRGSPSVGFNNINFYDKKNKKWYSQVASGDIPQSRSNFCAVGIQGDEYPYFEIFIHGGAINHIYGPQTANSDHVYILSLPSFRWFRASYTPGHSRGGHTCHATNSSQMIMIGGLDPTNFYKWLGDSDHDSPDPWSQGIGVFDMTALEFKDSYQANAGAYKTPDIIKKYHSIDGNKYPQSWTTDALKEIFGDKSNGTGSDTTNPTTSNSTIPPAFSNPSILKSSSRISHGVAIGVVVGCTALAIVLGAFGATFLVKQRRRRTKLVDSFDHELASNSPSIAPRLEELPAERREQETSPYQDRGELPGTTGRYPIEISTSEAIIPEMSTENYRSRA